MSFTDSRTTNHKPEIVYVFDAYCGWCWGFSEVISQIARDFADRFTFHALCGGLITGARIGPIGDFGAYIERAIPRVAQLTGARFSDAYLARVRNRETLQDSRVPAAVFSAVLDAIPTTNTMALAHSLLSLHFAGGHDMTRYDAYTPLLAQYGLDVESTLTALARGKYLAHAEQQFALARTLDAATFPTLVYGRNGEYFPFCRGYQNHENLAYALSVLYNDPPPLN